MDFKTIKRIPLLLSVALVLFVGLFAKIPTSQCHCHDPKSSKQQKTECPFGQLRNISVSILPVAPIQLEVVLIESMKVSSFLVREAKNFDSVLSFEARAPPKIA